MEDPNTKCETVQGQISEQISLLEQVQTDLTNAIERLQEKVVPVLREAEPKQDDAVAGGEDTRLVPIASKLRVITRHIIAGVAIVQDLNARIES